MPPAGSVSIARRVVRESPPPAGRLVVVRHSHTAWNRGDGAGGERIRGWLDVPLDADGTKEAKQIGSLFSGVPVALVMASDLQRAARTGAAIARASGAKRLETKDLRPWNLGDYQGQPSTAVIPHIHSYYVKAHPEEAVPGGESFNQFRDRFLGVLEQGLAGLRRMAGGTLVFVTSYRNLKLLEAWVAAGAEGKRLDLPEFFRDSLHPGAIYELVPEADGVKGRLLSPGFADDAGKGSAS